MGKRCMLPLSPLSLSRGTVTAALMSRIRSGGVT
jgi:hypothetical protein